MVYASDDRLVSFTRLWANGTDAFVSPNTSETTLGAAARYDPLPLQLGNYRATGQFFSYDGRGNLTSSVNDDDSHQSRFFDRGMLQMNKNGYGSDQLVSAVGADGSAASLAYDEAGNVTGISLVREGACEGGGNCSQRFEYDWNEVGQLLKARRFDFAGTTVPPTGGDLAVDLEFAYHAGVRVRKTVDASSPQPRRSMNVSGMQRFEASQFDSVSNNYTYDAKDYTGFVTGGKVVVDPDMPSADGATYHLFGTEMGDHLGSSQFVVNRASSELVEKTDYLAYGQVESDFRPARSSYTRESYKFTGHEDDNEVGLSYFGYRYYSPFLGRFVSPDPVTIQGLGLIGDPNPYAYVGGKSRVRPIATVSTQIAIRQPWRSTRTHKRCLMRMAHGRIQTR